MLSWILFKFKRLSIFVNKRYSMGKSRGILIYMLFTFIIFKCGAQGQKNFLGIKGGIAIPNLTANGAGDNPLNTGYSSRLGPDVAVFWEQAITDNFSILPSIEYASQGGKKAGFQPFPLPPEYSGFFPPGQVSAYLYADFKNEIQLDYILLNVLAKLNWHLGKASPFMLYTEVGPFGAYLVSAKDVATGSGIVYLDEQKEKPA